MIIYGMIEFMQEKLVGNNYYLNQAAKDAFRSYILAYNSHSMKDIFNVHRLDLQVQFLPYLGYSPPPWKKKSENKGV